jgi:hypothetical protein
VEGSYEHGNEPSGSIKWCEIYDRLNDWRLLKKDSAPWTLWLATMGGGIYIQTPRLMGGIYGVRR